ncbi:3-ketoacyl-CoA synthase 5 [Vitis vinifera]|uniref:3-ketoacyl-CoA synthase 5 n=1 Tax=Vitis vinifera TaxID=29760 RepID=A0A438ECY2_VITVI|nr:3-ketoacyl-CoA synthase 5 [Vitis vinifera]
MLVPNCLFRMGGAAILLTNRRWEHRRAKYRLVHVVRTHKGADDKALPLRDGRGRPRRQSRDIALQRSHGHSWRGSQDQHHHHWPSRPSCIRATSVSSHTHWPQNLQTKLEALYPRLQASFRALSASTLAGVPVIDELQQNLQLSAEHVEASRMALHRFGNTSSSSLSLFGNANRSIEPPRDGPWLDCIHRYPVHIPEVVKL